MIVTLPGQIARGRAGVKPAPLLMAMVACVATLTGCASLRPGTADADVSRRVYAGAGALASRVEPDTSKVSGTSVADSMSSGGSFTLGFDVSNRVSVEGHVASLGEAALDPAGSIGYSVGGISAVVYGLNDRGARSRREGFAVFGRLGVGAMDNDASGVQFKRVNDVHLLAGVGLEVGLARALGLRAELVAHETDAKYVQLGLVYRFGDPRSTGAGPESPLPSTPEASQIPALADEIPLVGPGVDEMPELLKPAVDAPAATPSRAKPEDADGDSIPDGADQCPETAEGIPVKGDGCAIFGGVVEGVNFEPGSDTLTGQARTVLDGIARTLRDNPGIRIYIEAHTDNLGTAVSNLQLSKRRAIAVARYLVEAGISGSRLKPRAFGESRPRTSNLTAQGRADNRRVEFSIVP